MTIDGKHVAAGADYTMRFVDHPNQPPAPVLYFRGLRVIKPWTLELSHEEPADPYGISGGKE